MFAVVSRRPSKTFCCVWVNCAEVKLGAAKAAVTQVLHWLLQDQVRELHVEGTEARIIRRAGKLRGDSELNTKEHFRQGEKAAPEPPDLSVLLALLLHLEGHVARRRRQNREVRGHILQGRRRLELRIHLGLGPALPEFLRNWTTCKVDPVPLVVLFGPL